MAHDHDDHGHGHLKLEYQPALPISSGKLCLWLFLSTEIMFFAGLIGTYIVLRFGAPPGTWPLPHDVHCRNTIGAFNTFVLICSSVTIVLALEAAKQQPGRPGQGLDGAHVRPGQRVPGREGYEYNEKFTHGIYPAKPHSLIYEKADMYYVQAVRQNARAAARSRWLAEQGAAAEGRQVARPRSKPDELALYDNLLTNLVQWTELKAAKDDDPLARRLAMEQAGRGDLSARHARPAGREAGAHYVAALDAEAPAAGAGPRRSWRRQRSTIGSEQTGQVRGAGDAAVADHDAAEAARSSATS